MSGPSATARLIGAACVLTALDGRGDAENALWCERFLSGRARDRVLMRSVRSAAGRMVWRTVERLTLPGIVSHWMARKRLIARAWESARAAGFSQLLVLGAGLDALAWRAAQDARVCAIEMDLEGTQRLKEGAGRHEGWTSPALVRASLASPDWSDRVMSCAAWDTRRPTFVVIEGVLMYLTAERARAVLSEVARLAAPRVRVAFTFMEVVDGAPPGFSPRSLLVDGWLRLRGEPMRWGANAEDISEMLGACGLRGLSVARPWDAGHGVRGELVCVASAREEHGERG
jgi:methyltransferase (TIGR00027 family)